MTKNISPSNQASFASHRDSSIELLRLICMFLIVLQHVIKSAIYPEIQSGASGTPGSYIGALMLGFVCVGVNCFILISGFFGIKFKLRSLFNLYTICAFYNLIAYGIHIGLDDAQIGRSLILNTIFPFSHSTWWFINCYVQLYFLAPLLNIAIEHMNRRQHTGVIILITFINVYIGHFWQTPLFANGMDTMHFIYLYLIGRFIKLYVQQSFIDIHRYKWIALFIILSLFAGAGKCLEYNGIITYWKGLSNESPLLICSAIGLFLYAKSHHFYSSIINTIAISTLAIYLGHEHGYIKNHLYSFITSIQTKWIDVDIPIEDFVARIALAIECSLIICVTILLFDRIRLLLMKPIWTIYDKIETKIQRLIARV